MYRSDFSLALVNSENNHFYPEEKKTTGRTSLTVAKHNIQNFIMKNHSNNCPNIFRNEIEFEIRIKRH